MNRINRLLLILLLAQNSSYSQDRKTVDSSRLLPEITVTAFEQNRSILSSSISVKVINLSTVDRLNKSSLVNGLNSVAGVRMEERSPGSYRLNIRGSSLRSPFGVRNVKIYWNNIPVTDPGGNTYFNQFAFNNFSSIEIAKGPAGSMYGSGTGGLLLLQSIDNSWHPGTMIEYITGSYSLQNIFASVHFGEKENRNTISYAHNQSDGYRDHSTMRRDNLSWSTKINLTQKQQLDAHVLFTDMEYQTPGGLTQTELSSNPKQARPTAGAFPSAQTAKAAIYQKNFLAGVVHQYYFNPYFKNSTSLYGAFAQIKNPTFRNYERRNEPHFGGRTVFSYEKKWNDAKMQWVAGGEWQQAYFNTQVSKNKNGNQDTLQTNDDVQYTNYSVFVQGDVTVHKNWIFSAGGSINKSSVEFTRLNKYPVLTQGRTYKNEFSPRISILKKIKDHYSIFASVSKGFSPPTVAELLPSTGVISTFLEAEQGINYEIGNRLNFAKGQLQIELTAYYFKLNNALVLRKDNNNADYYVNAGDATQKGIELSIDYIKPLTNSYIFEYIIIRTAQTFNNYIYGNFKKDAADFSGKHLPSVPNYTASILADLQFKKGIYINCNFYHASRIFLNDANTAETKAYDLSGARIGWKFSIKNKSTLNLYMGIDNIFNEAYSLGNDINAAAGRYYNAAPARNFYIGAAFHFLKKSTAD
ncbi:MAG: TonB-dependent receptor [Chitinophagaceae bacterium]